ncbi:MAG: quinone-dependent dihydroorotate dehydrogenase [Chloroflexi bacterium]|nr:quinone-dependent dihydroorotate dehydrogenase [Chloroflexota bacterium]
MTADPHVTDATVEPSGWFAVQLRYGYVSGELGTTTLVEDRVILVDGEDEEAALGRAVEMAPQYEDEYDGDGIHHLTLSALTITGRSGLGRSLCSWAGGAPADAAPVEVMGLRFRNRIGVGAGFDKDGVAIRGWAALGLGHVELGTVTPRPQPGNPRPRLFRLPEDQALANRMGFNNAGADALARHLEAARPSLPDGFVVGVNIGRNRDTPRESAIDDYVAAARAVAPVADYIAINVSTPNTPGVRDLQRPDRIGVLLDAVGAVAGSRPLVVKLSPDLDHAVLDALLTAIAASPARGVVLSNTTVQRDALRSRAPAGPGGVSGGPLLPRMLARLPRAQRLADRLAIVASGGVSSGKDARAALDAGADLIQLWTGLVYVGPGLIGESVKASQGRART